MVLSLIEGDGECVVGDVGIDVDVCAGIRQVQICQLLLHALGIENEIEYLFSS